MHHHMNHPPRIARSGISLLEVLISMFIILVGLLGVAAMLPVGRLEIAAANQADRSGNVARAAFRELKVRRLLDPRNWRSNTATNAPAIYTPGVVKPFNIAGTDYLQLPPVVLDPLGISPPNGYTSWGSTFPVNGLPRLTIAGTSHAWADSVFRSQDDLRIDTSPKSDLPPLQQWDRINPSDPSSTAARRQSAGDYSWLATIVPDPHLYGEDVVTVSVAVFHKRNLFKDSNVNAVPPERDVGVANMIGTNLTLVCPPSTPGTTAEYLAIRPGHWLLMKGYTLFAGEQKWTARWYRVVNSDDVNGSQRIVTLAGPDWPIPESNTVVTLIDNVINVVEKNVRLEIPDNPWKR